MKKNNILFNFSEKKQIYAILTLIFVLLFMLNSLTPLIADDYSYSFGLETRIGSLTDIVLRQYNHFMTWGGRNIAHSLAQIFLMYPKWIFNLLNSMVFCLLTYLIYCHAKDDEKEQPSLLIGIFFTLYFLVPSFGQTCLWLVGSCNYLWMTSIILLFLLIYRNELIKNDSIKNMFIMFILGLLSGWSNENTSVGMIVLLVLLIFFNSKKNKQKKYEKWKISGLVGAVIGFLFMILAPGNYVRAKSFVDDTFIIVKWIKRTLLASVNITTFILPIVIGLAIVISYYIYKKKKIEKCVYYYIAAALFTIYSMVLSPEFPSRSWFGVVIFSSIALFYLLNNVLKNNRLIRIIFTTSLVISLFIFIKDYYETYKDIYNYHEIWNQRLVEIEQNKLNGNYDVIVECFYTDNDKNPLNGLADISEKPHGWPTGDIERYYELNSLKCEWRN